MTQKNVWKEINKIEFESVKNKLRGKKSWWWNCWQDLDKLEKEYKQFLYLIAVNPGKTVVPWTQNLDDFWHEHILDTKKYEKDCQNIFGAYIHHNPHLAVGTDEQSKAYRDTKKMYKEAFGDKAKGRKKDGAAKTDDSSDAGCGAVMPIIFCSAGCGSSGASCSSGGGASCSSGGSSCGGDSSCGSGCGGGGCGGGD